MKHFAEHNLNNSKGLRNRDQLTERHDAMESFRVQEPYSEGSEKRPRPILVQVTIRENGKQIEFGILETLRREGHHA